MAVLTPHSRTPSQWTASVTWPELQRLVTLASTSLLNLHPDPLDMFKPDLGCYEALIHIKPLQVHKYEQYVISFWIRRFPRATSQSSIRKKSATKRWLRVAPAAPKLFPLLITTLLLLTFNSLPPATVTSQIFTSTGAKELWLTFLWHNPPQIWWLDGGRQIEIGTWKGLHRLLLVLI